MKSFNLLHAQVNENYKADLAKKYRGSKWHSQASRTLKANFVARMSCLRACGYPEMVIQSIVIQSMHNNGDGDKSGKSLSTRASACH